MERWKRIRAGSGAVSLCLLAGLLVFPMSVTGRVLMILPAIAGFIIFVAAERRISNLNAADHMIRINNHHRHDWMNDTQVLLGLVRLNKTDKLQDYMDKIKSRALHESNLAKLGLPSLIVYLFDLRAENRMFSLEVEIEEEIDLRQLSMEQGDAYRLIRSVMECFAHSAVPSEGEPNAMNLAFQRDEEQLVLDFVYTGQADPALAERLRGAVSQYKGKLELEEEHFTEEKAVLTLLLPFRT